MGADRKVGTSMKLLFWAVDLGALETVGIVYVNRLPFGIEIYGGLAALAVSVASGLGAAEGKMHLGSDSRRVHVRDSGIQVARGAEGGVHVAGVDGGRKAIDHVVGDLDGVVEAVGRDERDDRAEDLFLSNAHLGIDVAEDCGLEEVAVRVRI